MVLLTLKSLKKILQTAACAGLEIRLVYFMPHYAPRLKWAAIPVSITPILWISQDVNGRRQGKAKSLASPWARRQGVLAQVLVLTSPEHYFEVGQ